jgi:hypothetical protein
MSIHLPAANARMRAQTMLRAAMTLLAMAACSTHDSAPVDTTRLMPAPADASAPEPTARAGAAPASIRGTITAISDSALTVATADGPQQISIVSPLRVYTRVPSDLAHVTPNAFVGITSVAQADGSQRATEIHVFPEALRGTGEGSRMMQGTPPGGSPSTMTNGSVSSSRMTNGNVAGSRMTNGSVSAAPGGGRRYTVQYQGGEQTIDVPSSVTVTSIVPTRTPPAVGANVVVLTSNGAGNHPTTSTIMLAGTTRPK